MNTRLVAIGLVVLVVGGIALEALVSYSMSDPTNPTNPTNPSTPTYVDSLVLDSVVFQSNMSATLYLRQMGNATATLTSYKVTSDSGDSYLLTTWTAPTIPPLTGMATSILIGGSCPSCVVSGTPFAFRSGNTYSITVYTSDGNQFSFQARKQATYQITLSIGFGTIGHA